MEHSPSWEANRCVASQDIPRVLLNPKVHYRTQVPAISLYPEPAQFSPYPHIPLPEDPSWYKWTCPTQAPNIPGTKSHIPI
jgi:hypothetical protein